MALIRVLFVWFGLALSGVVHACPPPDGYVQCGGEGNVCELTGAHLVTFGVFGDYDPGRSLACTEPVVITGPVTCSEAALGALDPGNYKTCWVKDAPTPPPPPASAASAATDAASTVEAVNRSTEATQALHSGVLATGAVLCFAIGVFTGKQR